MKRPLLVGVTGGMGSGKSLICKAFEVLGIPVFYADDRGKWLMNNDPLLKKSILLKFGKESYKDGLLNRSYLAKKVFNNKGLLNALNMLVHPAVRKNFEQWIIQNNQSPYLIKEAALIFETGGHKELDFIINVAAPERDRIERVKKRDPFRSEKQIRDILTQQLSDEERSSRADLTIINDNKHLILPQIYTWHLRLSSQNIKH